MAERDIQDQPWRITLLAVGGLIVGIIVVGLVGLFLNYRVGAVTDEALNYDVELEDKGDDLRVAVLDVRHYHRNLMFGGTSRGQVASFEEAYSLLQQEIKDLEELGVRTPTAPQPEEFRTMAGEYYAGFRPAVDLGEEDPEAFTRAADRGLQDLEELELAAQEIDQLGEQRSAAALTAVEEATQGARLVLFTVLGGLALAGVGLAYSAVRVVEELRRLYSRQRVAAEELARASQAKTDFIADVSHELRTPLTVLRGNAEVGLELERGCVHEEILEEIRNEANRMSRMVEDLLLLARSDAASLPLEMEPVAAELFMAEVAGRAETLVRERGTRLRTRLWGEGELRIDPAHISQAVMILVDNAAKYGPADSPVTLASAVRAGWLHVEVSDRGPGIPEKDLPHVFERFYRVDKARARKQGGAGLGLPIARTIVEAHGGNIEAWSRAGKGTRMSISLPLLGPELPEPHAGGAGQQAQPVGPDREAGRP